MGFSENVIRVSRELYDRTEESNDIQIKKLWDKDQKLIKTVQYYETKEILPKFMEFSELFIQNYTIGYYNTLIDKIRLFVYFSRTLKDPPNFIFDMYKFYSNELNWIPILRQQIRMYDYGGYNPYEYYLEYSGPAYKYHIEQFEENEKDMYLKDFDTTLIKNGFKLYRKQLLINWRE